MTKDAAINQLKNIQKTHTEKLNLIQQRLAVTLNQNTSSAKNLAKDYNSFEGELTKMRSEQSEYYLRQEFIDRLIFSVESQYNGTDIKGFMIARLARMAQIEAQSRVPTSAYFFLYLKYLGDAIRDIPEPTENIITFIDGYMKFSSISQPLKPNEYISLRSYTNGSDIYTAKSNATTNLGDVVEKKVKEAEVKQAEEEKQKAFEARRPVLKDVSQAINNAPPTTYEMEYLKSTETEMNIRLLEKDLTSNQQNL